MRHEHKISTAEKRMKRERTCSTHAHTCTYAGKVQRGLSFSKCIFYLFALELHVDGVAGGLRALAKVSPARAGAVRRPSSGLAAAACTGNAVVSALFGACRLGPLGARLDAVPL